MIRRLSIVLVSLILVLVSGRIQARADDRGFFLSAAAGAFLVSDDNTGRSDVVDTSFVPGYGIIGALGYEMTQHPLRFEAEVAYRKSDLDDINSAIGTVAASGSLNALALMANTYLYKPGPVLEPYIGAGIGYARVTTSNIRVAGVGVVGGSDWSPALQGTLGVTFSGLPTRAKFGLEYRYFSAGNVSLTLNPGGSLVLDYDSHNVLVRIRYGF